MLVVFLWLEYSQYLSRETLLPPGRDITRRHVIAAQHEIPTLELPAPVLIYFLAVPESVIKAPMYTPPKPKPSPLVISLSFFLLRESVFSARIASIYRETRRKLEKTQLAN